MLYALKREIFPVSCAQLEDAGPDQFTVLIAMCRLAARSLQKIVVVDDSGSVPPVGVSI